MLRIKIGDQFLNKERIGSYQRQRAAGLVGLTNLFCVFH